MARFLDISKRAMRAAVLALLCAVVGSYAVGASISYDGRRSVRQLFGCRQQFAFSEGRLFLERVTFDARDETLFGLVSKRYVNEPVGLRVRLMRERVPDLGADLPQDLDLWIVVRHERIFFSVWCVRVWAPALLLLALLLIKYLRRGMVYCRRSSRVARGLCPACGYDLRESAEVCPECGATAGGRPGGRGH
jgi:hypothetical protein